MNYKLIESNQKIKRLTNDLNQYKNSNNIFNNNNNDLIKLKNAINDIIKLKNTLDEKDIQISKLNLDKENLEKKIIQIFQILI